MTLPTIFALAIATVLFAAIPGPGVMSLVAHSVTRGFRSAAMWSLGIVLGDLTYLLLALYGMGWVAQELGSGFVILKWCGAAYLIYLGLRCWNVSFLTSAARPDTAARRQPDASAEALPPASDTPGAPAPSNRANGKGHTSVMVAGLCVSLGNPKVIAFYCGFLPGFINMHALTTTDVILVIATIIPTVYAVLLCYAWLGNKGRAIAHSKTRLTLLNRTAGSVLIGSGIAVASK